MDELDDPTEEELKVAAELADALQDSDSPTLEIESLKQTISLFENAERWELDPTTHARGRKELEELTRRPSSETANSSRKLRWLVWLPVPALGALALFLQLSPEQQDGPLADSRAPRDFEVAETMPGSPSDEGGKGRAAAPRAAALADEDDAEDGFEKVVPRFHAGEIPPRLLEAQAALLSTRGSAEAQKDARRAFEQEMRTYRGQLIASLELGGR